MYPTNHQKQSNIILGNAYMDQELQNLELTNKLEGKKDSRGTPVMSNSLNG